MAKGGFPGMGGNMQQMMKQAQKLQAEMQKAQEELEDTVVEGSASGGMVVIEMTGGKEMESIKIKPEAVDPEDVELLEDLIVAAYNDAIAKVKELTEEIMGPFNNLGGGLF